MGSLPELGGRCFNDKVGSTPKGLLESIEEVLEELPRVVDLVLEGLALESSSELFLVGYGLNLGSGLSSDQT